MCSPGLAKPTALPDLYVIELEIEVSTHARNGSMPLPHDEITSITVANGGWYSKKCPDMYSCIYTCRSVTEVEHKDYSNPIFIKANSSADAMRLAYECSEAIKPDFANIHNGFNFDPRQMAASSTPMLELSDTFEERRLGNAGLGVY